MRVNLSFSQQGTWPHWTLSAPGGEVAALCLHSRPEPVFLTHSDPTAGEGVHGTQPGSKRRPLLSPAWESQGNLVGRRQQPAGADTSWRRGPGQGHGG